MKFTYSLVSDLHLDHPQPKTEYDKLEKFVVIAGDCGNGLVGLKFLNKLKNKGFDIFAIDGNHEHYSNSTQGRDLEETEAQFYAGLYQPNVYPVAEGLTVLGVNGWYYVDDERQWLGWMNDGRYAGNAQQVNNKADRHVEWLDAKLSSLEGKAVVVTHTAPCQETLNPVYDGHFSNDWYYNPRMGEVMSKHADKILVWNHGHTHAAADKIVGGVRVVCNPRGYPGENAEWEPLSVTVEY